MIRRCFCSLAPPSPLHSPTLRTFLPQLLYSRDQLLLFGSPAEYLLDEQIVSRRSRQNLTTSRLHLSQISPQIGRSTFGQALRGVPTRQFRASSKFVHRGIREAGGILPQLLISEVVGGADSRGKALSSSSAATGADYLMGGTYCVLLTGHSTDYTQKLYGGYGKMFIELLGDPNETWDVYAVVDGQFPPVEKLEKYDGFVVTGSNREAHGSDEWISKLCALLQSIHENKKKTLGICFGHQVLSRALGGKTGRADVGWEIGLHEIQTTDAFASKSYATGIPPVLKIFEVHRDQVQELPPDAQLLGFSERTGIEMFAVGEHALGIQGHPEFTEDVVTDLIDVRLASGILKENESIAAKASLKTGQPDREVFVQLCKTFLKRRN